MKNKSVAAGTTIVEFAIVCIAFFLLLLGLLDVGRGVWIYNSISAGAREGTRYAIVNGSFSPTPASATDVGDFVKKKLQLTGLTVNTVWDPDNSRGSPVSGSFFFTKSPTSVALAGAGLKEPFTMA